MSAIATRPASAQQGVRSQDRRRAISDHRRGGQAVGQLCRSAARRRHGRRIRQEMEGRTGSSEAEHSVSGTRVSCAARRAQVGTGPALRGRAFRRTGVGKRSRQAPLPPASKAHRVLEPRPLPRGTRRPARAKPRARRAPTACDRKDRRYLSHQQVQQLALCDRYPTDPSKHSGLTPGRTRPTRYCSSPTPACASARWPACGSSGSTSCAVRSRSPSLSRSPTDGLVWGTPKGHTATLGRRPAVRCRSARRARHGEGRR